MSVWSQTSLRAVTGGSWLRKPAAGVGEDEPLVESLSTDTRSVKPGQAFLALRGERFDAHEFIDSAAAAGAALLIVDRAESVPLALLQASTGPAILRVNDSRRALGQIAAAHRRSLDGTRVIAVVGSNGKTTTTRLIDSVLKTRLRGSSSPKSFNNDVGVPLTILAARKSDQYLVCEVGSNHPGEASTLGAIVRPDVVVVTSVGRDHMEFFDGLAAVAREHATIFADLPPGGWAIVPAEERALADYLKPVRNVLTFGRAPTADLRLTSVAHTAPAGGAAGIRFTVNDRWAIEMPLLGEHNALNALAAIAVAKRLGLDDASIAKGLADAAPADMRLNQRRIAGIELLVDCYNSNPDSLAAALATLAALQPDPSRRVLVLGDMLEMGRHSPVVHGEAAELAARICPARAVALVGEAFSNTEPILRKALPRAEVFACAALDDAASGRILSLIRPGDTVLLKGSRGVRLERLIAAMERTSTNVPTGV